MPRPPSVIGQRFGRLVVLSYDPAGKERAKVKCDCGEVKSVWTGDLRSGKQKSCGCLMREAGATSRLTHGLSGSPEYIAWGAMKYRAQNHPEYVSRGITICAEWLNDFSAFLRHIGPKPSGARFTVERINNAGNYEPGNVKWATYKEQNNNRRPRRWRRRPKA